MIIVHYRVKADAEAKRIATILQALGYDPVREATKPDAEDDAAQDIRNAVERITRRFELTEREVEVFDRAIVQGMSPVQVAEDLAISRCTYKWHMHNIFAKTKAANREALLRLLIRTQAEVKR